MALLCIVYWVCLIALCPNQRVQAGRAGVYRDALCCGLSQRAKNIHSTHGSEGEPIHSSVNTHIVGVIDFCTRDHMAVHKCEEEYLSVCVSVVGSNVYLHVTDNYPLCDFAFHSGKTQQTLLIDSGTHSYKIISIICYWKLNIS